MNVTLKLGDMKSTIITDEELIKLADFGKEKDGTYSDRWKFVICPNNIKREHWHIKFFNEVDGSTCYIKRLRDMEDLAHVYHAITDNKLEFI